MGAGRQDEVAKGGMNMNELSIDVKIARRCSESECGFFLVASRSLAAQKWWSWRGGDQRLPSTPFDSLTLPFFRSIPSPAPPLLHLRNAMPNHHSNERKLSSEDHLATISMHHPYGCIST